MRLPVLATICSLQSTFDVFCESITFNGNLDEVYLVRLVPVGMFVIAAATVRAYMGQFLISQLFDWKCLERYGIVRYRSVL
mgnify:CR=1 FL=1